MKVLYILPHSFISGASIQLRSLLNHLPPEIERTVFITNYDGVLGPELAKRSRLISITAKQPEERLKILKQYLINDFDILHVIEAWDGYQLLPHFNKKKIVTMYGNYKRTDKYFKKRISKLVEQGDDPPIMVTDNPRNLGLLPGIRYIKTGIVPPDPLYYVPRDGGVVWVGRNSDEKRLGLLFKIAKAMPEVDFTAVVSGPLPMEEPPQNLIMFNNIMHPIEMEYMYKSNSIYLNTSRHEGTPQALIEAMWCGCIPVCPDTGGIVDLVGSNGIIVNASSRDKDEKKNINRFVLALYLARSDQYKTGLRDAIKDSVKDYHIDNMIRDWEAIYNE